MVLDTGESVPPVTATTQHGDRVTVDFEAPTVLYFYPRDATSGCTTEAVEFDDALDAYREAGVAVYGVSTDDADSHREFAQEEDLDVVLLADPEARIAEAFGVEVTEGAAHRTTFVCTRGQVCGVYEGVHPEGHARTVLDDILDMGLVGPEE
jgi:peroxiredoxin Q/BCP